MLSQILITPISALTEGTRQVAAGDYTQKLEVTGRDEIGTLTKNFNHMARVLQLLLIASGPHPDSLQCGDVERKPAGELDACHVWHSGVFEKSAL